MACEIPQTHPTSKLIDINFVFFLRKRDCLRRLVVVLTERKKLQELCEFKYPGMEEEVGGVRLSHVIVM